MGEALGEVVRIHDEYIITNLSICNILFYNIPSNTASPEDVANQVSLKACNVCPHETETAEWESESA